MRSLAVAAGLCVAAGYLLGSVPVAYLLGRGRLRRDMRTFTAGHRGRAGRPPAFGSPAVLGGVLDAVLTLAAATVAWRVVAEVAPGGGDPSILAGVATFSDQVLAPWQSVALWTGLAAVVGGVAPVWLGLRGGRGLAPAAALLAVYTPGGLVAALAGFGVGLGTTRSLIWASAGAGTALVTEAWVAWIFDWSSAWGVPNGPELCLWAAALAVTVAAAGGRVGDDGAEG